MSASTMRMPPDAMSLSARGSFAYPSSGGAVLWSGVLRSVAPIRDPMLLRMPELPAVAEVAPGFAATFPYAMGAPAGTPSEIVARLNAAIGEALERPEIVERLRAFGLDPAHSTPQALVQAVTREIALWSQVVKAGGIKVD